MPSVASPKPKSSCRAGVARQRQSAFGPALSTAPGAGRSKPADANHTDLTAIPDAANSDADNAAESPHGAKQAVDDGAVARDTKIAKTDAAPTNAASSTAPVQAAAVPPSKFRASPPGSSRFEIRLVPPKRDRIDVKRHVDRDGHVSSRLVVNRANTLDMLRRDRHRSSARSSGPALKTSDNALDFLLRQQGFARDDDPTPAVTQVALPDDDPPRSKLCGNATAPDRPRRR